MTGLLLLFVVGLWAWFCWWLARRLSESLAHRTVRIMARALVFIGLLPLPLADEIYSMPEFKRLCQANAQLVLHSNQLSGKTIWFTGVTTVRRKFGLLPGREERWNYVIADTEEPAFHYYSFHVRGGWFMNILGISETQAPLLLKGQCEPKNTGDLPSQLRVTIVDKPH